jgi:hypothetical protein
MSPQLEKVSFFSLAFLTTIAVVTFFALVGRLTWPKIVTQVEIRETEFVPPEFLAAEIAIRCDLEDLSDRQQGYTDVLAVLTSPEKGYISAVRQRLQKNSANIIEPKKGNYIYDSLSAYKKGRSLPFASLLSSEMSNASLWVGYSAELSEGENVTRITVPTMFERVHTTRLFLINNHKPFILEEKPDHSFATGQVSGNPHEIKLAFQVAFNTDKPQPKAPEQKTSLLVDLFDSKMCRQQAPS